MSFIKQISSISNPFIKKIVSLNKANTRREENLTLVEGWKEIQHATNGKNIIKSLIYCPQIIPLEKVLALRKNEKVEIVEIDQKTYNHIAYRDSNGGVLALIEIIPTGFADLTLEKNSLILVLDNIEKPGNIGALLRTADAAGIKTVVFSDNQTDIYSPNVIRSSLGAIFTLNVIDSTANECIAWLQKNRIKIFSTYLFTENNYLDVNFKESSAIILGSEANGIQNVWKENSDELIKIPMFGSIDSMNVSVSAGIVIFEAVRQRKFSKNFC